MRSTIRHRSCALAMLLSMGWLPQVLGQVPRDLANDTLRIGRLLRSTDKYFRLWRLDSVAVGMEQALAISDSLMADRSLAANAALRDHAIAQRALCFRLRGLAKVDGDPMNDLTEALRLYEQVRDSSGMALAYAAIAGRHQWRSEHVAAVASYRKALRILKTKGNEQRYADVLNNLGVLYRDIGDLAATLGCHLEALSIIERSHDASRLAWNYILIGAVHRASKTWPKALAYFELARQQYLRSGEEAGLATSYNDLGTAHFGAGDLDSALAWHRKAAAIRERIGELNGLAGSQQYIGDILRLKGRTEEAMQSYRSSMASFARVPNPQGMASACRAIARVMNDSGDRNGALLQLDTALTLMVDFGRQNEVPQTWFLIGTVHADAGERSKAVEAYQRGIAVAKELGDRAVVASGYGSLYALYLKAGDERNAYIEHQHFMTAKDSVRAHARESDVMKLMLRHDLEQLKLKEDAEDATQRARQEMELGRQRLQKNMYLAGGGLFALLALGLVGRLGHTTRTRKRLEAQRADLERAKARAGRSEKFKEQFLANMSHEIRTPMNAIMGMTAIMLRNKHLPSQRTHLDAIAHNADNLLHILNDILDLSKMDAGMLETEVVPMDPRAIASKVIDGRREKAAAKGIGLACEVTEGLPRSVPGDPTRVEQILANLVDNAIKSTERGGVRVVLSASDRSATGVHLVLTVRDTSPGIPADRVDRIFEEFAKAYSDGTRKYGGTGLGLTISKRLVELMGGTLRVSSEEGKGSTFTATIPCMIATDDPSIPDQARNEKGMSELRDLRILLAEDNEFNVMVAQDELTDAIPGVQVDVAANGRIALEMAQVNTYDVILMDVQMPEMNGYDAARAIHALHGDKSRVPILAMTANAMNEELERCEEAGMNGHVPKPFKQEELILALQRVLRKEPSA